MEKNRKLVVISDFKCDLCGACVGVCPENVIRLSINKLSIHHEDCTRCSKCIWICPVGALELADMREFAPHETE